MTTYRDYFLSPQKAKPEVTYRVTLSAVRTGVAFMYHSTPSYSEALRLLDKYIKNVNGVSAHIEVIENA